MYFLYKIDGHKKLKKIEANHYLEALTMSLEEMGFIVEAEDNFQNLNEKQIKIIPQEEKIVEIKDQNKIPFTYKALEIFNLLQQGEYTFEELVLKIGVTLSTIKTYVLYEFKKKGYLVKTIVIPGRGMVYTLRES